MKYPEIPMKYHEIPRKYQEIPIFGGLEVRSVDPLAITSRAGHGRAGQGGAGHQKTKWCRITGVTVGGGWRGGVESRK